MIAEEDVLAILSRLQGTKASGVDDIRTNILELTAPAIAKSLCDLFNLSLQTSKIPVDWKATRIIPIPKAKAGGGGSNLTDFCAISMLPIILKVFESLVYSQMYEYLQHHGILHLAQSGFRPNHSTQDVLSKTVDDWWFSLNKNTVIGAVFIDLRKAFDSINHKLLLQKLRLYGFKGVSFLWFQNYLTDRKQRGVVGDNESQWAEIHAGVPRGSILGPILFSIFINDLPTVLARSKVMLYADDTTIYCSDVDVSRLKETITNDLVALSAWIVRKGLSMNMEKTQFEPEPERWRGGGKFADSGY